MCKKVSLDMEGDDDDFLVHCNNKHWCYFNKFTGNIMVLFMFTKSINEWKYFFL